MMKFQFWVVKTDELNEHDKSFLHCPSLVTITFEGVCDHARKKGNTISFEGYATSINATEGEYTQYLTYIASHANDLCQFVANEGYSFGFIFPAGTSK